MEGLILNHISAVVFEGSFLAQKPHLLFSQVCSLTKNITHGTFPKGKKNLAATVSYYFFPVLGFFSDSCKHT